MTPKEKANALLWKYLPKIEGWDSEEKTELAKELSIVTVQECIDTTRGRYGDYLSMQYWLDVEKEIKLL
jgi:hypothetical protein